MGEYSHEDRAIISELLNKYRELRGYTFERLGNLVGCDKSHLHHLSDPKKSVNLSEPLALSLATALQFEPEDYDAWVEATHLSGFIDKLEEVEVEREGRSLLRTILAAVKAPSYVQKWALARFYELRYRYKDALPLLEAAIHEAVNQRAAYEVCGIMYQDLVEAHFELADLRQAKQALALGEEQYLHIVKSGAASSPAAKLGLARVKVQRFQIAVWEGGEGGTREDCLGLLADALVAVRQIHPGVDDHYGWCKALVHLGYLYLMEGEFESAADTAKEAYKEAQKIGAPLKDVLWTIRDGGFLGSQWNTLFSLELLLDAPGSMLAASPDRSSTRYKRMLDQKLFFWARWAQRIPPVVPFWAWRYEPEKTPLRRVRTRLLDRIEKMRQLGSLHFVPLTMIAYGDFVLQKELASEAALQWYEEAKRLALQSGQKRLGRFAERRIEQHRG